MNLINCSNKIGIVGVGMVGATIAYTIANKGIFNQMVLVDRNKFRAEGEAMDISHGLPFSYPIDIYAGDYQDLKDASIVIITAGAPQLENETRLDLVKKNTEIFKSIIPQIMSSGFNGYLIVVSNPVDILTQVAIKLSGLPKNKVIGSGTVLDTARLKYLLGQHLDIDPKSIHAFILGEHGDSEFVNWSSANVAGIPINDICEMRGFYNHLQAMEEIGNNVKNAAYEVIKRKKATYYGIGMAVTRIIEAIIRDEESILSVSTLLTGELNINDVVLSMPCIVSKNGVEKVLPIKLDKQEYEKLINSAKILKDTFNSLDLN